jgi:thiamine pyrophosphate-dependent acetolactate synthase large subunit-like protein
MSIQNKEATDMKMNGARIIVESLKQEGVDTLFCFPGGTVIPLFDELYRKGNDIRLIIPRHEQGGVHAASDGRLGGIMKVYREWRI